MDIRKKISELGPNERAKLRAVVLDSSYDEDWCAVNGIDYLNPDSMKVNEIVYQQLFAKRYKLQSA